MTKSFVQHYITTKLDHQPIRVSQAHRDELALILTCGDGTDFIDDFTAMAQLVFVRTATYLEIEDSTHCTS